VEEKHHRPPTSKNFTNYAGVVTLQLKINFWFAFVCFLIFYQPTCKSWTARWK